MPPPSRFSPALDPVDLRPRQAGSFVLGTHATGCRLVGGRGVPRRSALAADQPGEPAFRQDRPAGRAGLDEGEHHHPPLPEPLHGELHLRGLDTQQLGQWRKVALATGSLAQEAKDGVVQRVAARC